MTGGWFMNEQLTVMGDECELYASDQSNDDDEEEDDEYNEIRGKIVTIFGCASKPPHRYSPKTIRASMDGGTKKSVHFACDDDGNIDCEAKEFDKVDLGYYDDIWWSNEEIRAIRRECGSIVSSFKQDRAFLMALAILYESHTYAQTSSNRGAVVDRAAKVFALDDYWNTVRGLEMHIYCAARNLMRAHRSTILLHMNGNHDPVLLRRQSRDFSRTSSVFASLMGDIDANRATMV